ncbi:hypothetical protein TWF730_005632 [Orbilia blumenaviensis]|uniref:Uncharacterized protein n=1 Tax=Orbilia blumenaviensis TaxID=1796055 RepID=A0AAV9VQ42_9PEZI
MSPLTRRKSRLLHDFYNSSGNLSNPPQSPPISPLSTSSFSSYFSAKQSVKEGGVCIITVTIPISRAVEQLLVPHGTKSETNDMVLRWQYMPSDNPIDEVIEKWRKTGDVLVAVSRPGKEDGEERYRYLYNGSKS